jgi:hypothetical protein
MHAPRWVTTGRVAEGEWDGSEDSRHCYRNLAPEGLIPIATAASLIEAFFSTTFRDKVGYS